MDVFVTGASGFVGRVLVEHLHLIEEVRRIYCLYRQIPHDLPSAKVIPIEGNLEALRGIVMERQVHIMIHLAGCCNSGRLKADTYYETHVAGTEAVINFCHENDIRRFIYMSSNNVVLEGVGHYGKSKLMAEALVKDSEIPYMIIRPTLIYGSGDHGLSRMATLLRKYPYLPVIGGGESLEQPIYVEEVIGYILGMMRDFKPDRVVTLGGATCMTYNEMMNQLAMALGKKARLIHLPAGLIRLVINALSKLGIGLPFNQEQIAHIAENEKVNMDKMKELYPIRLRPFLQNIQRCKYMDSHES